jgi:hypothetical protein
VGARAAHVLGDAQRVAVEVCGFRRERERVVEAPEDTGRARLGAVAALRAAGAGVVLSKSVPFDSIVGAIRVLHPQTDLQGSILEFDPVRLRAWYEDGIQTAREGKFLQL